MEYIYTAVFELEPNTKETYNVYFPDLAGCSTFGDSLKEALEMAEDALAATLLSKEEDNEIIPIPTPMQKIKVNADEFVNLIKADTTEYKKTLMKSVRKNVTLPLWLNKEAEAAKINFSQTLQDALMQKLELN